MNWGLIPGPFEASNHSEYCLYPQCVCSAIGGPPQDTGFCCSHLPWIPPEFAATEADPDMAAGSFVLEPGEDEVPPLAPAGVFWSGDGPVLSRSFPGCPRSQPPGGFLLSAEPTDLCACMRAGIWYCIRSLKDVVSAHTSLSGDIYCSIPLLFLNSFKKTLDHFLFKPKGFGASKFTYFLLTLNGSPVTSNTNTSVFSPMEEKWG